MTQLTKRRNGNGSLFPSFNDDFFGRDFFSPRLFNFNDSSFNERLSIPPANIEETSKEFKIDLSVPGMGKADFKIDVEDGVLNISSEKEEDKTDNDKNFKRREFSYSSFSRSFSLPDNVDESAINAKYNNGVLQLTIPKKEGTASKPKKQIQVS
jgi:HSP20 family protein